ncbi:hypothetical protein A2U01_0050963, partial [Trifolium medium]|nr:hypothetical protein [Trifolium medium]
QALEVQTWLAVLLIRQAGSGNWTYGWSIIHLLDGVSTQLGVDFKTVLLMITKARCCCHSQSHAMFKA